MLINLFLLELSKGSKNFVEIQNMTKLKTNDLSQIINFLIEQKKIAIKEDGSYQLLESGFELAKRGIVREAILSESGKNMRVDYLKMSNLEKILLDNMFKDIQKFIADIKSKQWGRNGLPTILVLGKTLIDFNQGLEQATSELPLTRCP